LYGGSEEKIRDYWMMDGWMIGKSLSFQEESSPESGISHKSTESLSKNQILGEASI